MNGSTVTFTCVNDGNNYIYRVTEPYFSWSPGFAEVRLNSSKKVVEADICFNTALPFGHGGAGYYDVWTVFMHEAGHVLGLDHPTNTTDAAMYSHPRGTLVRALRQDDINGIAALYG
ncbi:matrixin family metalloprotease [Acutalibacter caecimuris]|uniref:matrixin family metalloprotease n=1 Tax=Acutalibacter caecimuris TaxID=3093657 RepID=UPI002AC965AE|nr:matrixin family metalloprotease [Acutalibacter sp. M00118]